MPRRTKNPVTLDLENTIESHVAARIRLRRGLLGFTQSGLAQALGITFQQVQKYERGSNRVSVGKLVQLAEILDVPITFFFDGLELQGDQAGRLVQPTAEGEAGPLGRKDLYLLRAWRGLKPEVADAFADLLRQLAEQSDPEAGDGAVEKVRRPRGRRKAPLSRTGSSPS